MKNFLTRFLTVGLLALLLFGAVACDAAGDGVETRPTADENTVSPGSDATPGETEGSDSKQAPDFTALDWEGNEVKLSDFFGKPIVLNFWASWCPPCKAELPDFEAACKKYEGKVTFLMVNMTDGSRETVEVAKRFVESEGYTFPVYFDTKYEASYNYGVSSIPQTYFIDAEGNLVAYATGMITGSQLEQGIGMIRPE